MNHVYRVVFNHALKCVQVVSEFARGRSSAASSTAARRAPQLAALSTAIALGCLAPAAQAINTVWVGAPGSEWHDGSSWSAGVPTDRGIDTPNDTAYVNTGGVRITGVAVPDADEVHIGNTGAGRLDVYAGGTLQTNTLYMATNAGSLGRAVIDGTGSQWNARYSIGVGHFGQGDLTIRNGGSMTIDRESYIASMGGSTGIVRIDGAGSTWNTGNSLFAGQAGNGTVEVTNGGLLSGRDAVVGNLGGSVGRITLSDSGSHAEHTGTLTVGNVGQGTYEILNGASATNGGATWIGRYAGSQGDVLVSGADSTWTARTLVYVGQAGNGSFVVDDGAVATVLGSIDLAMTSTSTGTITIGQDATLVVGGTTPAYITAGAGQARFELAGGTLRVDPQVEMNTAVSLSADSLVDVQDRLTAQGAISGAGQLRKIGAGTLDLFDVDNTGWSGGVQLDAGTLQVGGSKALGTGVVYLADDTTLGLGDAVLVNNAVSLQGEVGIAVADGASATLANASGTSSAVLVKRDAGTLTLTGGTVGESTRVEAGTLRVTGNALNGGNIEIGSNGTFEIDTTRVLDYAGQFSGDGFLRLARFSMTLSGDNSGFTGTTVINAGQLNVTGELGGDVQVTRGGWLTGTGTLGNVFVSGGSTVSPGNTMGAAISRLDINGVLNFDSSSTLQVDVAADGASDFISVGGSALLGQANTVAVATEGDWKPSTRYHLLSAAGGITGTFAGASSNLAFLTPTLEYDPNNVYLVMARNDVSMPDVQLTFPDVVVNPNQQAVAGAVEQLGEGNAVYDAVVRLALPEVVPAFDSLSGEVHAAHRGTLLQNRFLHDGIDRHLDGRAISGEVAPGVNVWLAGSGGQLRTDGTAGNTAARVSQDGLMAGAGWQVGASLELGVAAGSQRLETRLQGSTALARSDATEYGVYAHYQWNGLTLRGGVTRADYRTDSSRAAQVGTTFAEDLVSREDATGTTAFVRAGWTFGGPRLQITPEIELAQVRLESDGSQERGGHSALRLGAADSDYRTGLAALKADWDISGGQRDRAVLTARVGWQYADGDRLPATDARFVEGTRDFAIAGTPLARSTTLAQLGVAISPSANSRVSLQVQGRSGGEQREIGAQLDWSVAF